MLLRNHSHNNSDGFTYPPAWPDAPRYAPKRTLPIRAYRPGNNDQGNRPSDDHQVHSPAPLQQEPIDRQHWWKWDDYLFGIDLYHRGFFWESHEAWERVWRRVEKHQPAGLMLSSLILNSSAQMKLFDCHPAAAAVLAQRALERLMMIPSICNVANSGLVLGLRIERLYREFLFFYNPILRNTAHRNGEEPASPPRLILESDEPDR